MKAERRRVRVRGLLALAATPTFAAMALWSVASSGAPGAVICSASPGSPLDAMTVMYLLMSVFHLSPWLRAPAASIGERGQVSAPLKGPRARPPHAATLTASAARPTPVAP